MATSTRQFNIDLYLEHLEEASFLYQQRLAYLHDPEVQWPALASWEDRFEAHVDALVVGEDLALEICRKRAVEGDTGEKHAALCVFCRQQRKADAFAMLEAVDPADDDLVRALTLALRTDAPSGWREDLLQIFDRADTQLTHVVGDVIGYRRFPYEDQLLRKLATRPAFGTAGIAWALGRVGTGKSIHALSSLLHSDDEPTVHAAATALLRLGDTRVLERAMQEAPRHPWARRALGLGGGPTAVRRLLEILKNQGPDTDNVLALGLLGNLAAIMPLVNLLSDDAVGPTAAVALNTITGASLRGTTFVPEQFDPDELSDGEREAFEQDGTLPTRAEGEPYGTWVTGPLRDPQLWRAWLDAHKHNFDRQYRWRMGQPYGPAALVESLRAATSPYVVRQASYEELVIRYGLDVPFEVELRLRQQRRFMQDIARWAASHAAEAMPGEWYFAAQLQM